MRVLRYLLLLTSGLLTSGLAQAFDVVVEFSAEAVQQAPSRGEYRASMYVSKNAVRTESVINNVPVVEIMYPDKNMRVMLIPQEKIYLQQQSNQPASGVSASKSKSVKPCEGVPNTTCKKLGNETINGRQTEKWEFLVQRNGQSVRSLHWIDTERRMPIREFFPDGTVTELSILGKEKLNGRQTEKWSMQMTRADGQQMKSLQWYDPELKLAIREEMQGGFVRELKNVKAGKQDRKLFEIPPGYRKVEQLPPYLMPPRPAGQ